MDHVFYGNRHIFLTVHGSAKSCEQVGVSRCDDLVIRQMQGADKRLPKLG